MRDHDVRAALKKRLEAAHHGDPNTLVVEEMGVWAGSVRIDVAVINGELCGFELKSDRDTLERLPQQAELYSRVFDRVTLVVGARHAKKARQIVPKWWGVTLARLESGEVRLFDDRQAKPNPSQDPMLVAQLLWREEALQVLDAIGMAKGWRSKSAPEVHRRLADVMPLAQLALAVRTALKARQGWLGQSVGNERKVAVHANLNPGLAAPWGSRDGDDLLNSTITPATREAAETGMAR